MNEISVKVTIANRIYPLKVTPAEEESIRKAAKLINDRMKVLEESYAVRDKQDLLAMCCLQMTSEVVGYKAENTKTTDTVENKLIEIDRLLDHHLKSNT